MPDNPTVGYSPIHTPDGEIDKNVPLDMVILYVSIERAEILDKQIRNHAAGLSDRNADIREGNDHLAAMKSKKLQAGKGLSEMDPKQKAWLDENNIKTDRTNNDDLHYKGEWDVNIQYLQGFIDLNTSESQLDMTKLKNNSDQHNRTYTLAVNFIDSQSKSKDGVLSKL